MSNAVTKTLLHDSTRHAIMSVTIVGDGSGEETDTVLLDASALQPAADKLIVDRIEGLLTAFSAVIEADATADLPIARLPADEHFSFDFRPPGFSTSKAGAGATGDVTITTASLGNGDAGTFTIFARKVRA